MKRSGFVKRFEDIRLRLMLFTLVLLAMAVARPTVPMQRDFFRYVFVYDLTQSMNVADAGPLEAPMARLVFARNATQRALVRLPCGSEVGLAIFAGHRTFVLFAPVEVCAHYSEIASVLQRLDWRMGWEAKSEVAKGLHSGLHVAKELGEHASLVFFTDGHEAPPINEQFRPVFEGTPGQVKGALVGVGGQTLSPIPKYDTAGRQLGYWAANDVMQVDAYSLGRPSSVAQEQMAGVDRSDLVAQVLEGTEHLSSLRESYLEQLAVQLRLRYQRLEEPDDLDTLLKDSDFAEKKTATTDISWVPGALALAVLLSVYVVSPGRTHSGRRTARNVPGGGLRAAVDNPKVHPGRQPE